MTLWVMTKLCESAHLSITALCSLLMVEGEMKVAYAVVLASSVEIPQGNERMLPDLRGEERQKECSK